MILSVSRRTDIPAFYPDWFYNRIGEGFLCVRNPMNYHQVSKVALNSDVVDCISFGTKDPGPMIPRLNELDSYKYYFQVTVNPYGSVLERSVPEMEKVTESMIDISVKTDTSRVIWRYDPVFYTDKLGLEEHLGFFAETAKRLSGYVRRCIIGYLHLYNKTTRNIQGLPVRALSPEEAVDISCRLKEIAEQYGIELMSCSDSLGLEKYGIGKAACIDPVLISEICGYTVSVKKDRNQRPVCNCAESIDIGEYGSCPHGCLYCYANKTPGEADRNHRLHDPDSPLLLGNIMEDDIVKVRKIVSFRTNTLF
ncbi:MAG: DUF1848 domain-containing protein [Rikenellaceae bacterium]|nr:DUF1848 domain-containing protein [Rikenellaceae bacterium]